MDQNNTPAKEQSIKQQAVEHLKNANNVLVTVSTNPSVDQLAACIGLTLMMNKLDKHATAVFSGAIPSTIDFLQPEKTLEMNTDSLRDFIISLDKSKADKLRYKVEDDVVRIYITPYRTSISGDDLEFTQGDFNVDVVVALGVENRDHLDQAILDHGRILHDAVVIGVSCGSGQTVDVGSVNWHEDSASSLCEMLVSISESFKTGLLDSQISTAFLTGIVAETDRFSNDRTTPKVMTMSAQLMAAGANQQLIANQLAIQPIEPEPPANNSSSEEIDESGVLHIDQPIPTEELPATPNSVTDSDTVEQGSGEDGISYSLREESRQTTSLATKDSDSQDANGQDVATDAVSYGPPKVAQPPEIEIDEHGNLVDLVEQEEERASHRQKVIQPLTAPTEPQQKTNLSAYVFDAPDNGGTLTANTVPEHQQPEPSVDYLAAPNSNNPILEHNSGASEKLPETQENKEQTLEDLERAVDSPHLKEAAEEARNTINAATNTQAPKPQEQATDGQQGTAPPPLPPPLAPPPVRPQPAPNGELNLPNPQR